MRRVVFITLTACALSVATVAKASPLFELIGGQAGMGGMQARATQSGAAATYFNPALLGEAATGLTIGEIVLHSEIGIRLDPRGTQNDVPDGAVNAGHADRSPFDG